VRRLLPNGWLNNKGVLATYHTACKRAEEEEERVAPGQSNVEQAEAAAVATTAGPADPHTPATLAAAAITTADTPAVTGGAEAEEVMAAAPTAPVA